MIIMFIMVCWHYRRTLNPLPLMNVYNDNGDRIYLEELFYVFSNKTIKSYTVGKIKYDLTTILTCTSIDNEAMVAAKFGKEQT